MGLKKKSIDRDEILAFAEIYPGLMAELEDNLAQLKEIIKQSEEIVKKMELFLNRKE